MDILDWRRLRGQLKQRRKPIGDQLATLGLAFPDDNDVPPKLLKVPHRLLIARLIALQLG